MFLFQFREADWRQRTPAQRMFRPRAVRDDRGELRIPFIYLFIYFRQFKYISNLILN